MSSNRRALLVVIALPVGALLWLTMRSRAPREPVDLRPADSSAGAAASGSSGPMPPKWDTEETPTWRVGVPLRPMDRDIIAVLLSGHVARTAMPDIFPDRPYQVRLAGNPDEGQFQYVLIDMNRDGKWDERWDLSQPGQIRRQVPHDPDALNREVNYTLTHGRWQPH